MQSDEQLRRWVAGELAGKGDKAHLDNGNCCPDFSCCTPDTLAPQEEREHFLVTSDNERERMLMMFLGRSITAYTDKKVYVTGPDREPP